MSTTSLNISVIEKRMMNATEAAHYCGIAVKHFKTLCPVRPVLMPPKYKQYDRIDLDKWLDNLKADVDNASQNAILDRL
ncbi:hypothetical protein [Celeribacter neptunius]|uniref:Transcriptional regulator, AlpA family n=1 Tax=Celeribacter neptunius TaxID=588602 RepID=A0A1I3TVR1_9RHOB|nr:hypothetical protein [Celeribacter neptunius]SFJ74722.1 hypothetical protein SAMN04487991_2893 [Celeribacter neptunius]